MPVNARVPVNGSMKPHMANIQQCCAFQSTDEVKKQLAEVYEWIGDSCVEECIGRCVMCYFEREPFTCSVYYAIQTALFTNDHLSQVYQALMQMDSSSSSSPLTAKKKKKNHRHGTGGHNCTRTKKQADVVESLIGELILTKSVPNWSVILDEIFVLLIEHEYDRRQNRIQEKQKTHFNPFSLLPHSDTEELEQQEEEKVPDHARSIPAQHRAHTCTESDQSADSREQKYCLFQMEEPSVKSQQDVAIYHLLKACYHLLRTSKISSESTFDIYKMYGNSVLTERISQSLVQRFCTTTKATKTPAELTYYRQGILSKSSLASCARMFRFIPESHFEENEDEVSFQASALRVVVGYAASVMSRSYLVDQISALLIYLFGPTSSTRKTKPDVLDYQNFKIPPRLPTRFLPKTMRMIPLLLQFSFDASSIIPSPSHPNHHVKPVEATADRKRKRKQTSQASTSMIVGNRDAQRYKALGRYSQSDFLVLLEQVILDVLVDTKITSTRAYDAFMCQHQRKLSICLEMKHSSFSTEGCLSLVMKDSSYRFILHSLCHFHQLVSTSRTHSPGIRITDIRRPKDYVWHQIRFTTTETTSISDIHDST